MWSAVASSSRRLRSASPWLRAVIFGGNMHPDCICGTRLVGLLARLRLQEPLHWNLRHGHPVATLHLWLLQRGWHLVRPFLWKCDASLDLLDLTEPAWDVRLLQHSVRSGWRAWCLAQHRLSKRHDAHCADLDRFTSFSQIDVEQARSCALSCPEARTITVGASVSPAMLQGRTGVANRCVWGCGDLGTWDHIAWSCSDRPNVADLPPRPSHQLTSRYGWKVGFVPNIDQIQAWLVQVQSKIWMSNHHDLVDAP